MLNESVRNLFMLNELGICFGKRKIYVGQNAK